MKLYDLTLSVGSALGTPLAADTLFGHICWGIRYADGTQALTEFLGLFEKGEPPLLLSDPFPAGYWPIPILPTPLPEPEKRLTESIRRQGRQDLQNRLKNCPLDLNMRSADISDAEVFDVLKWLYKLRWISFDAMESLAADLSTYAILDYFIRNGCGDPQMPAEATVAHNSINRLTGTTGQEGGLYFATELHVTVENPPRFHVLIASDHYTEAEIARMFENALVGGYGKYKSKGKGKVQVEGIRSAELPHVQNPNAVILLGPCAPNRDDPADGYWQVFTRYGKLGGHWATGPGPTGKHNPFKRPVTMLKAGSVLKTGKPKPFYGRLIKNVHEDFKEVRHYALALAMPVRCDFTEQE